MSRGTTSALGSLYREMPAELLPRENSGSGRKQQADVPKAAAAAGRPAQGALRSRAASGKDHGDH